MSTENDISVVADEAPKSETQGDPAPVMPVADATTEPKPAENKAGVKSTKGKKKAADKDFDPNVQPDEPTDEDEEGDAHADTPDEDPEEPAAKQLKPEKPTRDTPKRACKEAAASVKAKPKASPKKHKKSKGGAKKPKKTEKPVEIPTLKRVMSDASAVLGKFTLLKKALETTRSDASGCDVGNSDMDGVVDDCLAKLADLRKNFEEAKVKCSQVSP